MVARRYTVTLLVAGLAVAACGSSDQSPVSVPADPVEGAADVDVTDEAAADSISVAEAGAPDDAATSATSVEVPVDQDTEAGGEQMFPDVIDATASPDGSAWTVAATLSSPYDTPERYADAWRVVGPDGTVYGERILTHDHASEQPFTRSESGIEIPDDVTTVTIEGRDQQFGYGGETFELTLAR